MTLRLAGSTSGYVEIDSQAVGGNNTMLLPTSNGSANQFLKNGSTAGTLGWSSLVEDSSGRVLVGTSTSSSNGNLFVLMPDNTNQTGIVVRARNTGGTASQSALVFEKPDTTVNSAIVSDIGTNYLGFVHNGAERMRVKSDGSVVVTANNASALTTNYSFTASGVGLYRPNTNTEIGWFGGASPLLKFNAWWDNGVDRLFITDADYSHGVALTQNSNAWGSFSDARLKQDITHFSDAINLVKAVNPCRFKWKSGLQDDVGFIAQELKPVLPEAVDGEESEFREDEDGRVYGPMTVKYEKLIPVLTAALQEAIAKIETLESANASQLATIAAMEARLTALEAAQ